MKRFKNPRRTLASRMEDLAYAPQGGRVRMILFGMVVPLVIAYFGVRIWRAGEAKLDDIVLYNAAAQAVAVTYFSMATFAHVRWFWGMLSVPRIYEIGTIFSLIGIIGGIFTTFVLALAG